MQQQLLPAADSVGDEIGRVIGRYIAANVASGFVQGIQNGGRQAQVAAVRQGSATGSRFARTFKTQIEAALANLPEVRLNANSSDAQREIAQIRAQLTALKDVRIGIDVSSADASAAITHLQERLQRLSASDADVGLRVDAGAAQAQLAAFQAEINRLDGQDVDIDVDTHSATAGFNALTAAALLFGPALIPVLPVVAAGLGAIAAAAVAAGAGLGALGLVAVPAFKQIGGVLSAQKAAQDAATQSTNSGAQAASQAASKANQLASAQAAVASAERNGARQIAQAQAQVATARKNVGTVTAQAAVRAQQAARQVQDAERALADAQKTAAQVQRDLTDARRTAVLELEDLNTRLADSVLSQRDAELSLKEATAARDAVLKSATSTELDKERALLQYDQAVQRLKEQTTETGRLKTETDAANKAGVEGSQTVKSAQEQVAQAQKKVADQTRALKDAQADQARTATQNASDIAGAQQRVADAQRGVGEAQVQAAESAASAQRQLAQAQQQSVGGVDAAAQAQARYQAELAKLSPAARGTMNAYLGLKTAFGDWSKSLQPAVMPIFTRALNAMKNALPGLTPLVKGAASAITELMDRASAEFKKPFWRGFKDDLDKSVKPAIVGLGVAFGNIFKGMAGIIGAFLPHMDTISGKAQTVTERFAKWGTSLKGSPGFEKFLAYANEMGPHLAETLGKIARAALNIARDLAPFSKIALMIIGGLADGINWVATKAPWVVRGIYGIVAAMTIWKLAVWAWSAAQRLATAAMVVFNTVSKAGPWGWIAIGIALVVGAIILLWTKCDWFRNAIKAVWGAIKSGGKAVIDWFTGPFSDFFTKKIPAVFRSCLNWVKRNWPWILGALAGPIGLAVVAIIKHWDDIKRGLASAWSAIKRTTLYPIRDFFTKTIPGWGNTLRDRMVEAFDGARKGIKTAWDKIKGIAKAPVQYVVDVVYNNGIRKVWNLVTDAFGGTHLDPLKFATGGIMPGYTPGKDVHLVPSAAGPVALSGGEAIMRPEWTRAVGAGYVGAMNAAARSGGVGGVRSALGFKDGGIFSGIGDALGGAWDKVKSGASWLADTFGNAVQAGVNHVVNPLIDVIPGGNIGFVGLLKDLMKGAVKRLVGGGKKGDKLSTPNIDYVASKGVEQWRPVVLKALAEVHQSRSLAGSTLRRMQQESGGNPTIVNRTDSNWQAGHPSVGLMQVIGPTFRSYAGKYKKTGPFLYGTSVNPMANVYSSMKYALGAYGSLSKAYDRAGGYDSGGYLQPGLNLAYNGTGRPEPVFTTQQANALMSMSARGGASGPASFEGQLFLDSGEFLGRVRGEATAVMHDGQQALIQVLNAS
jgi:phage-related protein